MSTLAEALALELGTPPPPGFDGWAEQAFASLETFWPGAQCAPEAAARAFARALKAGASLDELAGGDLLLAAATLAGDPRASAGFDQLLTTEVRRAVGPIDPDLVDEVTQLAREKLLVGRPRLGEYAGRGPLAAWLRAVAVRLALNARRPGAREVPFELVPDQPLADPDPELALLRARYRDQFREAFAAAVRSISSRERTLLRLTTLDGLSLARVGQMYGKDASTISRWLADSRATLLEQTRAQLGASLKLTPAELDSVMRAADSQLDLSISRLLQSSTEAREP